MKDLPEKLERHSAIWGFALPEMEILLAVQNCLKQKNKLIFTGKGRKNNVFPIVRNHYLYSVPQVLSLYVAQCLFNVKLLRSKFFKRNKIKSTDRHSRSVREKNIQHF